MEDEVVPSNGPADERRAAIEAAFAEVEAKAQVTPEAEEEAPAATTDVSDESEETTTEPEAEAEPVEEATTEEAPAEETKQAKEAKAPQSWKPAMREKFAGLDPEVKQEILRREQETSRTLQQTADARRFAGEVQSVLQPYADDLRTSGIHPVAVIKDLMNTAYVLRRGAPQDKAKMVADIIKFHGVDLETLDGLLAGNPPTAAPQDATAQRVARLEAEAAQRQRAAQDQEQATMAREIDDFASKNEFFGDVADLMQPLLASGKALSLKDAYEMACRAHPEVSKVVQSRHMTQTSTATKLAASSSVKGTGPQGGAKAPATKHKDWRSALEAQFDAHTQAGKRF